MNKKDLLESFNFKEIKNIEDLDNYTGDNENDKTYLLGSNEYVIANDNYEVFTPLLEDSAVITSVKDGERFVLSGDINALNGFAFLYDKGYLTDSNLYIFSNNDFDYDTFTKLTNEVDPNMTIIYDDFTDNKDDVSIIIGPDEIKVSKGLGDIYSYELENTNVKTR